MSIVAAREQRLALKVGLFTFVALALAGLVIFFIGREQRLFERKVVYRTYFESVEGLAEGSPVWLGGKEVGQVQAITFPSEPGERGLEVRMTVGAQAARQVREDSVARLSSLGVLGDKAVDISLGSGEAPQLVPGGVIPSQPGGDLSALLRGASRVMEESVAITRTLRAAVDTYADPELAEDVAASIRSVRQMLHQVERGDGVLHALIYDEQAGRQMRLLLAQSARTAVRLDRAASHMEALLSQVREGPGALHALFYDPQGAQALGELGSAADELARLLADARTNPDSALHQLFYGDAGNLLADLGGAAANLKDITGTISRGEGSLGGLIKDPTVYEELRTIVGNIQRNRMLRALVRYTLRNRGEGGEGAGEPLGPQPRPQEGIGGGGQRPPAPPLPLQPSPPSSAPSPRQAPRRPSP